MRKLKPLPTTPPDRDAESGQFTTKYKQEYCQELIEHMATGASLTSFAACIDVCPGTLHDWARANLEFREAKDQAFAKCQSWWEEQARRGLFDETVSEGVGKERTTVTRRMNSQVFRCVMANLFQWSDRQAQEVLTPPAPSGQVDFSKLSDDELRDLQRLIAKAKIDTPTPRRRKPSDLDEDESLLN